MTGVRNTKNISVDSNLSSGTIRSRITVSRDLEKYFRRYDFFSRYDANIVDNSSILDIPALSIVLPLAWITGADVYVDELDRRFAESMDAVHRDYKRMYPNLPFTTRLVADKLVDNNYESNSTALLFSGGLDSTYSLFSNIALKPRLIMIFGTSDIPISNVVFQKTLVNEYSGFAQREGLTLNFVRTNALELLDFEGLESLFGKLQVKPWGYRGANFASYWTGIGYTLGHVGPAAPLSIGRFSRLLVANCPVNSDDQSESKYPDSSHPTGRIAWANMRVKHDGNVRWKHEKALFLKGFLDEHGVKLRVCFDIGSGAHSRTMHSAHSYDKLNCNHCHKCLRTIAYLVAAGVDPNRCGFSVDQSTFSRVARMMHYAEPVDIAFHLKPLQQAVPDEIGLDRYGARRFFEWFKRVDLDAISRSHLDLDLDAIPRSFSIYYWLPYPIQKICRIAWNIVLTK